MKTLNCALSTVRFATAYLVAAHAAPLIAQPASPVTDIRVEADTRDIVHKLISVRESIAVTPGIVTLLYPQWIPGNHGPTGKVSEVAGLTVEAAGQPLRWTRHPLDPFAFDVHVPAGIDRITLRFDRIGALDKADGEAFSSPQIVRLDWHALLFYPAGRPVGAISTEASIVAPPGWHAATALEGVGDGVNGFRFAPTSLEHLVDSPAYVAQFLGRNAVSATTRKSLAIDVAAESAPATVIPPKQLAAYGRAFAQARKMFGSQPYPHYDFLVTLSTRLTGQGIEHQASSEDSLPPNYFSDPDGAYTLRHLMVHEYVHAWNGKLHRPAGLATPDYNRPMQDDLLWVYEGLTTYFDKVLTVRGGLWTQQDGRDLLAELYAEYDHQAGRQWRSLQDTTAYPVVGHSTSWDDWARSADYYNEGVLLWLDVDLRLRRLSGGRRSLDDFARAFLGGGDRDQTVRPYSFADVVAALDAVAPGDWAAFLRKRLDAIGGETPKAELKDGGYRLVYDDRPSGWQTRLEARSKAVALEYSWGARIGVDAKVQTVSWGGPAFVAGLLPGDRILTIDGGPFTPERLRVAAAANGGGEHVTTLAIDGADGPRTVYLVYSGGLRYPHLQPVAESTRTLDTIFTPL